MQGVRNWDFLFTYFRRPTRPAPPTP
jgi:hypothetical protein